MRTWSAVLVVLALLVGASPPAHGLVAERDLAATTAAAAPRPQWKRTIDRLVGGRAMGVVVRDGRRTLYEHGARVKRIPASNQKLMLSMALLERFGAGHRIPTSAFARPPRRGVIKGNLWVAGKGDPSVSDGGRFARSLSFDATRLRQLARAIKKAGVRRIRGRVIGATGYFNRSWYAPGWKSFYPGGEVALPTALTFNGNIYRRRPALHAERLAAKALTRRLEGLGIGVRGRPGAGHRPAATRMVAQAKAKPLITLLRWTDRQSSNFFAEVLGKRLGAEARGAPGSIAKGAAAIRAVAARRGVRVRSYDSSGLSSGNRVSASGLTRLLVWAGKRPWGRALRKALPTGGQGTLQGRLGGVRVRAKTGTLDGVSALSGWVRLKRRASWAEFSILSSGMPKYRAVALENRIVKIVRRAAR